MVSGLDFDWRQQSGMMCVGRSKQNCLAKVNTIDTIFPTAERCKLDSKSRKCILLGYVTNHKGYRMISDR